LAFHHGGLSLQELVIPVLSFELKGRARGRAAAKGELVVLEAVPKEITNLIFSLTVRRFKACKLMKNLDSILGFPSKVYTNRLDSFSFISDSDHR
jgi:hypothetical protein